jgi:hypothetical protein
MIFNTPDNILKLKKQKNCEPTEKQCLMCGGTLYFCVGNYTVRHYFKKPKNWGCYPQKCYNKPIWVTRGKVRRSKVNIVIPKKFDMSPINIWVYRCTKCLQIFSFIPLRNKTIFRKRI